MRAFFDFHAVALPRSRILLIFSYKSILLALNATVFKSLRLEETLIQNDRENILGIVEFTRI